MSYDEGTKIEQKVYQLLKTVIDPELMVNIIDLGLVYTILFENNKIFVELTLTSPGCPLGDVIIEDAEQVLKKQFSDYEVEIKLVWDPPWSTERLTEEGRAALGQ